MESDTPHWPLDNRVVIDARANIHAFWRGDDGSYARYWLADAATWGPPIAFGKVAWTLIAGQAGSNLMYRDSPFQVRRFDERALAWSDPVALETSSELDLSIRTVTTSAFDDSAVALVARPTDAGTAVSVARFDPALQTWDALSEVARTPSESSPDSFGGAFEVALHPENDFLEIGVDLGLLTAHTEVARFDPQTRSWSHAYTVEGQAGLDLVLDADGNAYGSTRNGGLLVFDRKRQTWEETQTGSIDLTLRAAKHGAFALLRGATTPRLLRYDSTAAAWRMLGANPIELGHISDLVVVRERALLLGTGISEYAGVWAGFVD